MKKTKITYNQFVDFISAISRVQAGHRVLVGTDIYKQIIKHDSVETTAFIFIECKFLEDKIMIFCPELYNSYISGCAVTVKQMIDLDRYIKGMGVKILSVNYDLDDALILTRYPELESVLIKIEDNEVVSEKSIGV